MDNISNQQPEGLEDQLRRMILHNSSIQPTADKASQPPHPTVRLPPSAPPQIQQNGPAMPSNRTREQWHANGPPYSGGSPANPPQPMAAHNHPHPPPNRGGYHNQPPHGPPNFSQRQPYFNNRSPRFGSPGQHQRARYQQQMPLDPHAFQRGGLGHPPPRPQTAGAPQLFNHNAPQQRPPQLPWGEQQARQAQHLEQLAAAEVASVDMSAAERAEKEAFRAALERICHEVCAADPARLPAVSLECFGSFQSGFATAGSDMDLVIVVKDVTTSAACFSLLEDDLPRALEKRLLQLGYGARLLTRTRVPIIKVCEKPDPSLLDKLREEREKWDSLPNEKKYPHLHPDADEADESETQPGKEASLPKLVDPETQTGNHVTTTDGRSANGEIEPADPLLATSSAISAGTEELHSEDPGVQVIAQGGHNGERTPTKREDPKPWTRERKAGPLDFPKTGAGIQSDINFFNPLGLHNTQMLRCYALCDPRVRPMVLFIKAWAKRRKINSSYSGTLSSYGYVLMVLHYLVNVVQPSVLPNLQSSWRPYGVAPPDPSRTFVVENWPVAFWHNEDEIRTAVQNGLLTSNRDPLGVLLAGFFHYYSSQGGGATFRWMQEVLSLRSIGGLLSKEEKGWVKAVTEEGEGKRIQHRYLFCIEDPFELSHNVARTVTHNGIVAIRDEFRRAKRILQAVGNGFPPRDGELFATLLEAEDVRKAPAPVKADAMQTGGAVISAAVHPQATNAPVLPGNGLQSHSSGPKARFNGPNRKPQSPREAPRAAGKLNGGAGAPTLKKKSVDVNDNEAFPTLGASRPSKKKHSSSMNGDGEHWGEISGDKARMVLEEVKRKKDEAQAESTATWAAEAVLGDSD